MRHVVVFIAVLFTTASFAQTKPKPPWVWFPDKPVARKIKTNASLQFTRLSLNDNALFERAWKLTSFPNFSLGLSYYPDSFGDMRTLFFTPPKSDTDGVRFYRFDKDDRMRTLTLTVFYNTEFGESAIPYPDGSFHIYGNKNITELWFNRSCLKLWFEGKETRSKR